MICYMRFNIMEQELKNLAASWEHQAGRYFVLAERETDPLGKKFYHSSAVALCNCATELRKTIAAEFWVKHPEIAPLEIRSTRF